MKTLNILSAVFCLSVLLGNISTASAQVPDTVVTEGLVGMHSPDSGEESSGNIRQEDPPTVRVIDLSTQRRKSSDVPMLYCSLAGLLLIYYLIRRRL